MGELSNVTLPQRPKVFLAHGHDEAAKQEMARYVERLGFEPVILQEQAGGGRFILENFEACSGVVFAIVLMTPDDGDQPRPNVLIELGFLLRALGRSKVRVVYRHGVQFPSDISGWLYVEMDSPGAWKLKLGQEMRAAGLSVDLNRLI